MLLTSPKKIMLFFLVILTSMNYIITEQGYMKMLYKNIVILNFSLQFSNYENYKHNRFEFVNFWGKLCFPLNYTDFENNCRLKYKGYNNKWVDLLINLVSIN